MNHLTADFWIQHLRLEKHPEGGAFAQVYSSQLILNHSILPEIFHGDRPVCTHIYYLLQKGEFSAFHRIQSDELWHFYNGDSLIIYEIDEKGNLNQHLLGSQIEKGEAPFCVIKADNWFATRLATGGDYALAGCTVSPGFDYNEFELAERTVLLHKYPQHSGLIESLSK
jgi:predicted cupin superfamily sugar epimerase